VSTPPVDPPREGPLAELFPGYFALAMATGIVAIGAQQQGLRLLAELLWALGAVAALVLFALYAARLVLRPHRFVADLTHHGTAFAFLTAVAAVNVIGSGAGLVRGWWDVAWGCWIVGLILWPALLYPALVGVILGTPKPDFAAGINGTWFLLTVSTQSVAALAALLLARSGPNQALELVALCAFSLGLVLYLIVMTLLFLRWSFRATEPAELQPPSWIAAGAVAITVLAGSNLLAAADSVERLERLAPYLEGMVVLAWATATFWLPVMIAMGVWRHVVRRVPLRYHPSLWSMVFPLGMYGACTYRMITVTGFDILTPVPKVLLVAALAAWTGSAVGLVRSFTA
jgi:tellurite resistance protein TehA-like permease